MLDALSSDYVEEVSFLAVAGRSGLDKTQAKAQDLMPSGRIRWGLDDSIWDLYGVRNQPTTVLISARSEIIDQWFGELGEAETRARIEHLIEVGA
ncbi:MAG TPA: hypothetical protein VIL12_06080 [Acidimicrobiia bacterium]